MSLTSSDTRSQTPTSDSVDLVLDNLSTIQERISTLQQDLVSIKRVLDEPPRSRPRSTALNAPDIATASEPPVEEEYTAWVDVMREVDPTFMAIPTASLRFTQFARLHKLPHVLVQARLGTAKKPKANRKKFLGVGVAFKAPLLEYMRGFFVPAVENGKSPRSNSTLAQPRSTRRRFVPYNRIIQELMPSYKTLPREPRIDIKRGVRDWLMFHLSEQEFEDCVIPATATRVQTYGIPVSLLTEFRAWASCELANCFRSERVLDA
ncbi:hypothetical protein HDU78_004951 [Chytriomyces hyalinus]|nr:hypothetical protein HDU78_004951 [Chytriomyces hyalinus]KAJ3262139.1 hypothetical protein HDU77_000497 [Chytriomyces hyalinus]